MTDVGETKATTHPLEPSSLAGPQRHLCRQTPLQKSEVTLKAGLEAERPAKGLDHIPDRNSNVVQGGVSVTMRTRAFQEHFLRPSAGQSA